MGIFVYDLYLMVILVLLRLVCIESIADGGSSQQHQYSERNEQSEHSLTELTLSQAISIVNTRRLTDCVARTICELSCDPEFHGSLGKRVYTLLRHFETVASPQLDYYKLASVRGKTCNKSDGVIKCSGYYHVCKTPANSLLRLASMFRIKS